MKSPGAGGTFLPPSSFSCPLPACHEITCCGQVWAAREYLGRLLASSRDFPGLSWDPWGRPGLCVASLWASRGSLGAFLGLPGPILGLSGAVWVSPWRALAHPATSRACLGTLWGRLGLSVASLWVSRVSLGDKDTIEASFRFPSLSGIGLMVQVSECCRTGLDAGNVKLKA